MTKEEFLSLIDRYLKGSASEVDRKIIDNFFASYEGKINYQKLPEITDEMWEAIRRQVFPGEPEPRKDRREHTGRPPVRYRISRKLAVRLILVCAITMVAALVYRSGSLRDPEWQTVVALPEQKTVVTLPDHSVVQISAGSSLTYPKSFASGNREVVLHGEAFFEVTKDPTKPFVVRTDDVSTTVLGTSFNVQAFPDENISVTVITGRVEVKASGKETSPVILTPGIQAVYDHDHKNITTASVEVEQFISWKDNIISFHDISLEEVCERLSRWYGVTLTLENDAVKHCRISGRYKAQHLKDVLESIEYMYNIKSRSTDQHNLILYGKGCQ